eukprot:Skav223264  [mRNA]  locus=scaffold1037:241907:249527:- [translate_table: standard]
MDAGKVGAPFDVKASGKSKAVMTQYLTEDDFRNTSGGHKHMIRLVEALRQDFDKLHHPLISEDGYVELRAVSDGLEKIKVKWAELLVREVAEKVIDDETVLRFIAVPVLVQDEKREAKLPPVSQVRGLSEGLFSISGETIFERVYILEGQVVDDRPAMEVLAAMQQRVVRAGMLTDCMADAGMDDTVEYGAQEQKSPLS